MILVGIVEPSNCNYFIGYGPMKKGNKYNPSEMILTWILLPRNFFWGMWHFQVISPNFSNLWSKEVLSKYMNTFFEPKIWYYPPWVQIKRLEWFLTCFRKNMWFLDHGRKMSVTAWRKLFDDPTKKRKYLWKISTLEFRPTQGIIINWKGQIHSMGLT